MDTTKALGHEGTQGQWRVYLLLTLSTLFYPTLFWKHNLGYNLYYLFMVMGVSLLLLRGWRHPWRSEERFAYLALFAVFAEAMLSYWANGASATAWAHLQVGWIPILGFIPLGFLFSRTHRAERILWFSTPLGLLGLAIVVFGHLHSGHGLDWGEEVMVRTFDSSWRASGGQHPVILGMIVVTMTLVVMCGMLSSVYRGVGQWLLASIAVIAGLAISVATGSRSSWLMVPLFFLGVFAFTWRRWSVSARSLLLAAMVVGFGSLAMVPKVHERVHDTYVDLAQYFNAGPGERITGSVGQRFEAWRLGLHIFAAHPLLGAGPGQWREGVAALAAEGIKPRWGHYVVHPHNLYISSLAMRGILGFVAESLFWWALMRVFGRRLRNPDPPVAALARAGVVVCASVFVYGLSDIPYGWWRPNSQFFFFLLALLLGAILSRESKAGLQLMTVRSTERRIWGNRTWRSA